MTAAVGEHKVFEQVLFKKNTKYSESIGQWKKKSSFFSLLQWFTLLLIL